MTSQIEKALKKLSDDDRRKLQQILEKIRSNSLAGLDIKKLKDRDDIFRVRMGKMRIIFKQNDDGIIFILTVERRSDTTYR